MKFITLVVLTAVFSISGTVLCQSHQNHPTKGRKPVNVNAIPPAEEDAWNLAKGEIDGKVVFSRYRPELRQFVGHPRLPRRFTITREFDETDSTGQPNAKQQDTLASFENTIVAALDPGRIAVLAYTHTYSGVRQWNFYCQNVDTVLERFNRALQGQPVLPIKLEVFDDPKWEGYTEFISQVTEE